MQRLNYRADWNGWESDVRFPRHSRHEIVVKLEVIGQIGVMKAARIIQAGFVISGSAMLLVILFGIGGWLGMAISVALTMPFATLVMFGMKCRNCGVSYYFVPSRSGQNLTGMHLLKPVSERCRKCGEFRS